MEDASNLLRRINNYSKGGNNGNAKLKYRSGMEIIQIDWKSKITPGIDSKISWIGKIRCKKND